MLMERARKNQISIEQLTTELAAEHGNAQKMESKVSNLGEQLSTEVQERMLAAKANRKLEKKIKELLMSLEDERRHADQYKEQNEKTDGRMKAMHRQFSKTELMHPFRELLKSKEPFKWGQVHQEVFNNTKVTIINKVKDDPTDQEIEQAEERGMRSPARRRTRLNPRGGSSWRDQAEGAHLEQDA